jgi:hypothetical protein
MKPTRTALLALAVGAALWLSESARSGRLAATAQTPLRACALLTDEQVKRLIHRGRRPDGPTDEMTVGRGGSGSVCGFNGGAQQLILFSGPSSEADFEALLKVYRHDKEARHPVSGVGDRAYIMYPALQNQYQRPTAFLVTRAGPHTLGVVVSAASREASAQSVQPVAVEVAKAAIAQLRSGAK